jgi:hypothetical protein
MRHFLNILIASLVVFLVEYLLHHHADKEYGDVVLSLVGRIEESLSLMIFFIELDT